MKKLLSILLLLPFTICGQSTWMKTYPGYYSSSMIQATDNSYIIIGDKLVKIDEQGTVLWENNNISGDCISQTSDGGFIISGRTSVGTDTYAILIKTDAQGDEEWSKTYGGSPQSGYYTDKGVSVKQTSDGGYIIAGYTASFAANDTTLYLSDGWLIRTDAAGDTLWTKKYGSQNIDGFEDIKKTSDGGYIVTGSTCVPGFVGFPSLWVLKLNSQGDTQWEKTWDPENLGSNLFSKEKYGYCVQQTVDGGYIVAGEINLETSDPQNFTENFYGYLIKLDAQGDEVWTQTHYDGLNTIVGEFFVSETMEIQQTTDGGYVYVATTGWDFEDILIVKTDLNGSILWSNSFGVNIEDESGISIKQTNDGGYIILGVSDDQDATILIKTNANGIASTQTILANKQINTFPNPTTGIVTIEGAEGTVMVYDIYGRMVLTTNTNNLDISQAADGIYFVRVVDEQGRVYSQKVVKE